MDAGVGGVLQRLAGSINRSLVGVGQRGYGGLPHFARHALHRCEVAGRADGEARLYHIDAQAFELTGYLHLLFNGHRRPGGLLAVAEGRVEYQYAVFHCLASFGLLLRRSDSRLAFPVTSFPRRSSSRAVARRLPRFRVWRKLRASP